MDTQKVLQSTKKFKSLSKSKSPEIQYSMSKFHDLEDQLQRIKTLLVDQSQKEPVKDLNEIDLLKQMQKMQKDIASNFKQIEHLSANKASINDVNDLLKDVYEELDTVPQPKITHLKKALFFWKTGKLVAGKIAWEKEVLNTDPSNFILAKNKFEILILNEGLYELKFGVFGNSLPEIQVSLNDEVICSSQNQLNPHLQKQELRHTKGNAIGLTIYDFFLFPFNSRIWVNFKGGPGYQGFVQFKKVG